MIRRSTGRVPIAQPPGMDTLASPMRATSGATTQKLARMRETNSYGAVVSMILAAEMCSACPLPVTCGLDHFSSNQACSAPVLISGNSGGIVRLALAFLPQRAASGLSLAPLEVFPQRCPQTLFLALPVRVFWLVIHGANVGWMSKLRQGGFR